LAEQSNDSGIGAVTPSAMGAETRQVAGALRIPEVH